MPDLSSFTQGTSNIASSDFLIGYVSAAGPGSERRWTAQDLTTGLLSLAGATPAELAHLSGTTGNIQSQINVVQSDIDTHEARIDNPHAVTATQVGLGSVDNTSDTDKPVSTLQQAAIDAAGAFSADADTLITPSTPIVLGQATGNEAALTLDYTTNKASSGDDTGLLINQTDTQSPGTSKLIDAQVGGVSKFSVDATGSANIDTTGSYKKEGATILDYDSTLNNVSVGELALSDALLTGSSNAASGYAALQSNTTGTSNTASGRNALQSNTIGNNNTASGRNALLSNTEGSNNTASGYTALQNNTTGTSNTAIGRDALQINTEGDNNTASGYAALLSNTTGTNNTASGYAALYSNTVGDDNTAVGYQAGRYQADGLTALADASDSVFIGKNTRGVGGATNQIAVGDTAIGLGSNTAVLGNDSIVTTALKGNVGLGTAAPGAKLHIESTSLLFEGLRIESKNNVASGRGVYQSYWVQSGVGSSRYGGNITVANDVTTAGTYMSFATDNAATVTEKLRIDADGNVGIGTTAPGATLDVATTWNDGATVFTGIKADITNTASAVDSKLIDLQVGGASKFSVDATGKLTSPNLELTNTTGTVYAKWDGATRIFFAGGDAFAVSTGSGETKIYDNGAFGWTAGGLASTGSLDLILRRDSAATLQLGEDHATTPTGQTIKAHDVVTGTGADLTLSGGLGSVANGNIILSGNDLVLRAGSAGEEVKLLPDGNIGMYNALGAERARFIYSANTPSLKLTQSTGKNTFYYPHGLTSSAEYSINAAGGVGIGTTTPGAALDVATTWNDGATVFTGIKANVTNTASAAGSKLLDLQVGGVSKLNVTGEGSVLFPTTNTVAPSSSGVGDWYGSLALFGGGGSLVTLNAAGMNLGSTYVLSWGSDLFLGRDSAATLQLGTDHATVATGQTIKAHDVVTGTGADLTLSGGLGDVDDGAVILQPTSGNVGIGTTTPSSNALLHVSGGDARFTNFQSIGILIKPVHGLDTRIRSTHGGRSIGIDTGQDFTVNAWDYSVSNYVEKLKVLASGTVGIGTTTPDANAILDVSSTTKAFLPPRMTTTEKNAVVSPTAGMVVYDSTLNKLAVYTGAAWEAITSA